MSFSNNPLVSIIVPVYNQEKYLDRCIRSVLSQDYRFIEVIIVDDGSTDSSKELIEKWSVRDERILAYYKSNGGLSDARNFGLSKASGVYILFVDSDDWIDSDTVGNLVSAMVENCADIVVFGYYKNYPDGREIVDKFDYQEYAVLSSEEMFKMLLYDDCITFHACRRLYKKSLIDYDVFPVGHNYEDAFAVPIMSAKCDKCVYLARAFYHYWQNPKGISSTFTFNNKMDYLCSFEHSFQLIEQLHPQLRREVALSREKHAMVAWDNYLVVNLGDNEQEKQILDAIRKMIDKIPNKYLKLRMRFVNTIVRMDLPKEFGRFIYRLFVMKRRF